MGIGSTLMIELNRNDYGLNTEKDFAYKSENEVYWDGVLIHPMTGYGRRFDYLELNVTLKKEGRNKYSVTQIGEQRYGGLPDDVDEEDEIDEYDIVDFDYDKGYEINQRDEFETLMAAVEFILTDALEYEG